MIDFVPCVAISIILKCQRTNVIFDFFDILFPISPWLLLWFLALKLHIKACCFWSTLRFWIDWYVRCVAIPTFQRSRNAVIFGKFQWSDDLSSGLTSSIKVAVEEISVSNNYWSKRLSICFLHWNLNGPQMPELFVLWTHVDFRTQVSQNNWLFSSFKVSV